MRTKTAQMIVDAADLVRGVDHVLANTTFESQLSSRDCFDLAHKLELAVASLVAVGNRKTQEAINADKVRLS